MKKQKTGVLFYCTLCLKNMFCNFAVLVLDYILNLIICFNNSNYLFKGLLQNESDFKFPNLDSNMVSRLNFTTCEELKAHGVSTPGYFNINGVKTYCQNWSK